jgi:hypothetical protein
MTSEPSAPTSQAIIQPPGDHHRHHPLCWSAVLAGTVTAIGIYLLLAALGVGFGLATPRPVTDTHLVATLSVGAAIGWSLYAIIALSFGGWVAGVFSRCPRSGLMNGVLVWSLTLIITLPLLVAGSGRMLGRAMKIHDEDLRLSRQAVAVAEDDLARTAAKRSQDQLGSFVEEAVQSISTNAAPKAGTRAKREVGFAVTKLFAPVNAAAFPANRLEAINTLMVYTEMSAADATTTIDAWILSHKNLQAELDKLQAEMSNLKAAAGQKAKISADAIAAQKARHLSRAARGAFFALLIGLLGAALGGRCGARCALQNDDLPCPPGTPI